MTLIFCTASCQGPRIAWKLMPPNRAYSLQPTKGISRGPYHRVYSSTLTVLPALASYSLIQIAHHSHHSTRFETPGPDISLTCVTFTLQIHGVVFVFLRTFNITSNHAEQVTFIKLSITSKPSSKCLFSSRELSKSSIMSRPRPALTKFDATSLILFLRSNCNNNGYYYNGNDCYYSSPWSNWGRWYAFAHANVFQQESY